MSRDSVILWIGMVGSILTAVANQVGAFPPAWAPYISLAALIVGVISGKLATSPLKGDAEIAVDKAIAIDKVIDAKVETGEIIDKGAVNLRNIGPLVLPLVLASALLMGCTPKPVNLTPEADKAWTADQVVIRVNRLMNAAISAESQGLPRNTVRRIVTFCVEADQTLAAVPDGWGPTVLAAWTQAKADPDLKPYLQNLYISAAVALVDAALQYYVPIPKWPEPIPAFLIPPTFSLEVV